jgi:dTDP-4-dehydrorhamnose 3,5-epimerase
VRILCEPIADDRGFSTRLFCADEFAAAGYAFAPVQMSLLRNTHTNTLRSLHFQSPPFEESKIVRARPGSLFDVAVDRRPASPTDGRWTSSILSAEHGDALLIPIGCSHGLLTPRGLDHSIYQTDRV